MCIKVEITFGKFITKGDVKGSEIDFNPNKDLFMLIHLIIMNLDGLNLLNHQKIHM